jgi:hypothetical protein
MKNFEGSVLTGIFNGIMIEIGFVMAIIFIIKLF